MPRKPAIPKTPAASLDFAALVEAIRRVHDHSAAIAKRAVNTSLTLRNWVIGAYIAEYELRGADRAEYGEGLLNVLAARLTDLRVSNCNRRQLYRYLRFFRLYPEIVRTVSPLLPDLPGGMELVPTAHRLGKVGTASPQLGPPANDLTNRLSYSHLELIVDLDDPLKRAFYEIECLRGNWSVRALKRQIASLYFERSGLSLDKDKLSAMANQGVEHAEPRLSIRDPYIFEFLGLKAREAVAESDLEQALLENLQDFLLELGHGFCLEARQKSIVIGDTRGFVDLVFYHRILRCHVLVELKVDEFHHEHIGQLNTYVAWFKKNMMREGDNPPIGLLLCTGKDHALVEYALSAMPQRLFVSKYQLELPSKEALQQFLDHKRKEMTGVF
ncbi:MAG: PDDEXK nuclease domain-containing protein [Verrucomicrobia bacterium]|nr:PDDEXK nuclease domain-containing protein [Verrucomicrobiota bacterium]